jgi:hypothetical protein
MKQMLPVADLGHDQPGQHERLAFERWRSPLAGANFLFFLSGMLALLTALGVALCSYTQHDRYPRAGELVLVSLWGSSVALIVAYGCRFLDSVIAYALCGGTKSVDLPDPDPRPAMTSLARWTLCFFTGPAFFVSLAIRYLTERTGFALVDGLILTVLTAAALTSWIIGRLVRAARRERDCPLPSSVLTTMRTLGWRAPLAGIGVTAAGIVHVLLAASAVVLLRQTWLGGFVLLWFCWNSAWQCATYSLWTVGIWCHRASRTGKMASRAV